MERNGNPIPSTIWTYTQVSVCISCMGPEWLWILQSKKNKQWSGTVTIRSHIHRPQIQQNGVNQCCVLPPTLLSMMFSAMITYAFQDYDDGFPINRFDGRLHNRRRIWAKSKMQTEMVDELLYADGMAKNATTQSYGSSFTSLLQLWSFNQHKKIRFCTSQHLESPTRGPLVLYRSPECWGNVKTSGYWGKEA